MNKSKNLRRFLAPKSIAFFGGKSMVDSVRRCRQGGFQGPVWLINPKHKVIDGETCFKSIFDLPGPIDAAFIGTDNETTVNIVQQLNDSGAAGAVCYASGFAEMSAEGKKMQIKLLEASGDMALIGPNCYGILDYLHGAALWPVAHGGKIVKKGVAILTQSGNFAYNLSMADRSLPIAYMVSVGNQASIKVHDLIEALLEEPRVTAIGIHIEGLREIAAFEKVSMIALKKGIPIIAMKIGASRIGAELALSHTSSLAGSDDLYNALFDRVGIIRVSGPTGFIETMKIASCQKIPKGPKFAALAVSGGDAGFIADYSETNNLELPNLTSVQNLSLQTVLPKFASISNPLDFTTAIWGNESALRGCVKTMLDGNIDFGFLVLDYPTEESGERVQCDLIADIFQQELNKKGIPGAIASAFPELLPKATREKLHNHEISALQGVEDGLAAIGRVVQYSIRRNEILSQIDDFEKTLLLAPPLQGETTLMNEWESKQKLAEYGVPIPEGHLVSKEQVESAAQELNCPVAVKLVNNNLQHKTEAGAVIINIKTPKQASLLAFEMVDKIKRNYPDINTSTLLVEKMSNHQVAELIIGVKREENFGLALIIGSGGILVELIQDSISLLLPTTEKAVERALLKLKAAKLLNGYRGKSPGDIKSTIKAIMSIANFAEINLDKLQELDVNPLIVMDNGVVAADAYISMIIPIKN